MQHAYHASTRWSLTACWPAGASASAPAHGCRRPPNTLDNIWPQCGPPGVRLPQRYFKQKDTVENYLANGAKDGWMDLSEAQNGIATDWTQYLDAAQRVCESGACR